jgi:hypothetical protein
MSFDFTRVTQQCSKNSFSYFHVYFDQKGEITNVVIFFFSVVTGGLVNFFFGFSEIQSQSPESLGVLHLKDSRLRTPGGPKWRTPDSGLRTPDFGLRIPGIYIGELHAAGYISMRHSRLWVYSGYKQTFFFLGPRGGMLITGMQCIPSLLGQNMTKE